MSKRPRVLAVASEGGHWVQLYRLRRACDGCDITYVTSDRGHAAQVKADALDRRQPEPRLLVVIEANRWQKLRLLWLFGQMCIVMLRVRPDIVITTGAAVGFMAVRLGRLIGARTAWIDSIANADELSMSGRFAGPHCDLWLTQWENLARSNGPLFKGTVL
jgi:hypothetical protein